MEIIGSGFLARHLESIADDHPDAVVLAAGVSSTAETAPGRFARETQLVHEVARQCRETGRRLVFFSTSSAAVYGRVSGAGREDEPVAPASPYGAHKLALERWLRDTGTPHLALRLAHLVGRGQPGHQLLPTLMRAVRRGRVCVHKGALRDLIAVPDAVRILDALLRRGARDETVNVASGTSVPVEAIVALLEFRLGVRAERVYEPGGTAHAVCIDKLRRLVPDVDGYGFGPHYYRDTVDAFLRWELTASAAGPSRPYHPGPE